MSNDDRLDSFLRNLPVGVMELCGDGKVLHANQMAYDLMTFCKIDGVDTPDLEAMNLIFEDGNSISKVRSPFNIPFKRRSPVYNMVIGINQNSDAKGLIWLQVNAEPLFSKNGTVESALISFVDISERKKNERVIAEQQSQIAASARLTGLGVLAGGVAHEINNPLAIINGRCDILKEQLKSGLTPEQINQGFEKITKGVKRIANIISGLRRLAGVMPQQQFYGNSTKLIADTALEFVKSRMSECQISLQVEVDDFTLDCSLTEISQALYVLLENAVDAVRDLDSVKQVRLSITSNNDEARFLVSDNGLGVKDDLVDKIFLPFFTTKPPNEAQGLGLSIAMQAIKSHSGELYLERNQPETTFVFKLPLEHIKENSDTSN